MTPMSPIELRARVEYLGLGTKDLADFVGVQDRTVRRWFAGTTDIPSWVLWKVEDLEDLTRDTVQSFTLLVRDDPDKILPGSVSPEERHHLPERWWRHVLARVLGNNPGAIIG